MIKRTFLLYLVVILVVCLFPSAAFAQISEEFESEYSFARLIEEAAAQAFGGDHTRLEAPVVYKMLWLAFTDIKYDGKTYAMSKEHSAHLKNVAKNFEKSVEKYTDGNIDIEISLEYIFETLTIPTRTDTLSPWPDKNVTQKYLQSYNVYGNYETVLTFAKFEPAGIGGRSYLSDRRPDFGYGFINCELPWDIEAASKKIPFTNEEAHKIKDYSEPTDITTLRAIHEWIHTIEWFGAVTGVEFPSTDTGGHGDYEGYSADPKVEWFSFYRDILGGKAKKSDGKLTGVFPKMWKLSFAAQIANEATYTIKDSKTGKYLSMNEDKSVTLSDNDKSPNMKWMIVRSTENDSYQIISCSYPSLRLDVHNAINANNTSVKGCAVSPDYISAQTWDFTKINNDSYLVTSKMAEANRGDTRTRILKFDDGLKIVDPEYGTDAVWIIKK